MGTVFLAEDLELGRQVAIKVLNTPEVSDQVSERMVREAQIIARLEHPGIARLLDAGVSRGGQPYLVLEYVDG